MPGHSVPGRLEMPSGSLAGFKQARRDLGGSTDTPFYLWLRNESAGVDCLLRDRAGVPLEKWPPLSGAGRPTDLRHIQLGCLRKKNTF